MKSKVETKVLRSSMTHAGSTVKKNVTTLTTPCATAMKKDKNATLKRPVRSEHTTVAHSKYYNVYMCIHTCIATCMHTKLCCHCCNSVN